MAGKRDEIFILGEEQVGADPWSPAEEEPSARAPVPGSTRSPRLRAGWRPILGALALVLLLASLGRSGGGSGDVQQREPAAPAVAAAPLAAPPALRPARPARPERPSPPTALQRGPNHSREPREKEGGEARAVPLAETASAPALTYTPAPTTEAAPEPMPRGAAAAPTPAAPLAAARPEFGIER
jgi:hypothetical protein